MGEGTGHIQSVVLASILISVGFQFMLTSLVVDLLSVNRRLLEDSQYRIRRIEAEMADREESSGR
jgi:hypothetical protein